MAHFGFEGRSREISERDGSGRALKMTKRLRNGIERLPSYLTIRIELSRPGHRRGERRHLAVHFQTWPRHFRIKQNIMDCARLLTQWPRRGHNSFGFKVQRVRAPPQNKFEWTAKNGQPGIVFFEA